VDILKEVVSDFLIVITRLVTYSKFLDW